MRILLHDLRYALRQLRKAPGFTFVCVLTLALGIGANTAIFSVLDGLLLRKLPVQRPEELVRIGAAGSLGPMEISEIEAFRLYREKSNAFSGVIAFAPQTNYEINRNHETTIASGEIVSGNYFSVLGVRSFTGRLLTADDEGKSSVVVLSYDYWRRTFAANRQIIGQTIPLNDALYTIVGVAPPEFFGMEVGKSPDLYLPLAAVNADRTWVQIFGRLKPGVSISQAQASLEPLFQEAVQRSSLPKVEIDQSMARLDLTSASRGLSELRAQFSLPAKILMAVVLLVLLIACANVSTLLLSRAIARRRELSVKQALGAGRWRLIQQLLTESVLLIASGTVTGLLLGRWMSSLLVAAISSQRLPIILRTGFNLRVFAFALGILVLTTLLCGLAPALNVLRLDLVNDLKVQEATSSGQNRARAAALLVIAQVALSVIVVIGAGLLLRSLVNLETFDPGFDRDHVLLVSMNADQALQTSDLTAFDEQLLERVKHLPGVHSASWSGFAPISGREVGVNLAVEGYSLRPGENAHALFSGISPGYFQTLGIPILQGRDFAPQDLQRPPRAAIINRSLARRFFGDADPLGKHLKMVEGNHPPLEIIGVVADSKYNDLREGASLFFYVPAAFFMGHTLEIHTAGNPKPLAASLPGLIRSMDRAITIASVKTLREQVDESLHFDRVIAALCGAFGFLALALICVGIFGTLSSRVARQTREIGIRMALGADRTNVVKMVLRGALLQLAIGLAIGIPVALASSRLIASQLYGVKTYDPAILGIAIFVLSACAVLAGLIPARRAASIEPMEALRTE